MAILDIEIIKIAFKVQIHKVINIPSLKYILNCLVKILKYFAKILSASTCVYGTQIYRNILIRLITPSDLTYLSKRSILSRFDIRENLFGL